MDMLVPTSLMVAFLWGVQPIVHKYVLKNIDPKTIMIVGGAFYVACLLVFAIRYRGTLRKDWAKLDPVTVCLIGASAVLTGFVANLLYFFVLKKHDSYVVSALIYAAPAFTLLLAWLVLHEKVRKIGAIGVVLVVLGTLCIALNDNTTANELFVAKYD